MTAPPEIIRVVFCIGTLFLALDTNADASEALFNTLITAVNIVHVVDLRFTFCDDCRNHERESGAQVRAFKMRTLYGRTSADNNAMRIHHGDICAHAIQ